MVFLPCFGWLLPSQQQFPIEKTSTGEAQLNNWTSSELLCIWRHKLSGKNETQKRKKGTWYAEAWVSFNFKGQFHRRPLWCWTSLCARRKLRQVGLGYSGKRGSEHVFERIVKHHAVPFPLFLTKYSIREIQLHLSTPVFGRHDAFSYDCLVSCLRGAVCLLHILFCHPNCKAFPGPLSMAMAKQPWQRFALSSTCATSRTRSVHKKKRTKLLKSPKSRRQDGNAMGMILELQKYHKNLDLSWLVHLILLHSGAKMIAWYYPGSFFQTQIPLLQHHRLGACWHWGSTQAGDCIKMLAASCFDQATCCQNLSFRVCCEPHQVEPIKSEHTAVIWGIHWLETRPFACNAATEQVHFTARIEQYMAMIVSKNQLFHTILQFWL